MFDLGAPMINPDAGAIASLVWWLVKANYLKVIYCGQNPSLFLSFSPGYYGSPNPIVLSSNVDGISEWAKYSGENAIYDGIANPFWWHMKMALNQPFAEQVSALYDVKAVLSVFYSPYSSHLAQFPRPWIIVPPSGIGLHRNDRPVFFHSFQASGFFASISRQELYPDRYKIIPGIFPLPGCWEPLPKVSNDFKQVLCLDPSAYQLCKSQNPHVWTVGEDRVVLHLPKLAVGQESYGHRFLEHVHHGTYLFSFINSSNVMCIPYLAFAGLYTGIPVCLGPHAGIWKGYFVEKELPFLELMDTTEESMRRIIHQALECDRAWISRRAFEVFTPHSLAVSLAEALCVEE